MTASSDCRAELYAIPPQPQTPPPPPRSCGTTSQWDTSRVRAFTRKIFPTIGASQYEPVPK